MSCSTTTSILLAAALAVSCIACEHQREREQLPAPQAPQAPPPSQPAPVAVPEPEVPVAAPVEPAPSGECATAELCSAAAGAEERQGHHDRAAPLYQRACELGLGQACHRLGELYQAGKGVASDEGQARQLFELGCRQGSNAACDALGH
jgi:TPR repeat protein